MVFEVTAARKKILQKLTEQDWTPTDLAEELNKSSSSVYNHLNDLHKQGILTKNKVQAKTRPKTLYSINNGFVQYVAILPGQFAERTVELTDRKEAMFRIWTVPQDEFHPHLEEYWHTLLKLADISFEDIEAVAVYGSVARGTADQDSDIDILLVVDDSDTAEAATDLLGSIRVTTKSGGKICMTEVYSREEYRNSVAHGSDFLESIQDELQIIHDPDQILLQPETVIR